MEHTHSFLKASLRKFICNYNIDRDELTHVAMMAYNVFPHSSAGDAPFYLIFGHVALMPTLFKVLLPKLRYMGDRGCKIQLDAMREIYMMALLNLKTDRGKCTSSNLRSR